MGTLALKLTLAPALVVAASLAGRRWGGRVSGVLIAIPLVAGPILLVITLEQGRDFGARAARGSLLGVVALAVFCVVFARVAQRRGAFGSLLTGWLAFAAVGAAGAEWDAPPVAGLVCALAALGAGYALLGEAAPSVDEPRRPPSWDLPARAGSTAALVFAITTAADALGPALSGILTPFPIATSILAVFTRAQDGPHATTAMLRGFVAALPGFALCFFAAAVALG